MPELASDSDDIRASLAAALESASSPEPEGDSSPAPSEAVEAPSDQVAEPPATDQRARDELGRFAPKDGQASPAQAAPKPDQTPAPAAEAAKEPDGQQAPATSAPPPSWSPSAKAAWARGEIPEDVRNAIAKRETEVSQGFAKLASYKDLDPYVEMARHSNTTLPEAIKRWIDAEQFLERDPANAILWFAQNYNVDLPSLAAQLGGGQQQMPQPGAPDLSHVLTPLQQELAQLRNVVYGEKQAQTASQVQAFFADPNNRYADNVADIMSTLLQTKQAGSLQEAYEKACWMNPEVRAELIREQNDKATAAQVAKAKEAAEKAKRAGKSVTGAPSAMQLPGQQDGSDLRAMLEQQFAAGGRA